MTFAPIRTVFALLALLTVPAAAEPVQSLFSENVEPRHERVYSKPPKGQELTWARFGRGPYDMGGPVDLYLRIVAVYDEDRALLPIDGTCVSSCTLLLRANRVCVMPDAMLWFHGISMQPYKPVAAGSRIKVADRSKPPVYDAEASQKLFDLYPASIQAWLRKSKALSTAEFTQQSYLRGSQLIAMGFQECSQADVLIDRGDAYAD